MSQASKLGQDPILGQDQILGQIRVLRLDCLIPARQNDLLYRPVDSSDPEIKALAESIRQHGVLDPLVVSFDWVIVSGHRRYAASRLAGLTEVPCLETSIHSSDPNFLEKLREYNRQREKTDAERLREEVVSADPEEGFRLLVEHRRKSAEVRADFIHLSGRKYPTNTIAPLSNLLQVGIDVTAERQKAEQGQPSSVGNALANLLMEQPYLKANPGDLTQVLTSGRDAKRQIGQQLGSFVPAGVADVAAQMDPYKRKQSEPLDYAVARLPGLSRSLPPQTDILGNPVPQAPGRLFNPFGGTPLGKADSPAMSLLQQDLSQKYGGLGSATAADQARQALTRTLLTKAGSGQDIRPDVQSLLQSRQINIPQARHLLMDSRLTPVQQKMEMLPLPQALDVYSQASVTEKSGWQMVMQRKLMGAARSGSLTPEMVQRAQMLGIVPRR